MDLPSFGYQESSTSPKRTPTPARMGISAMMHNEEFRHAALLYAGDDEFLEGTVPFIRDGLEAEEPVLVMVPGRRVQMLRDALGVDAREVSFADMTEVGANPAHIIPEWRQFAGDRYVPGGRLRGIGEPIWAGRSSDELVECQRHETLLNVAFAEGPAMLLLCPYDTRALDPAVIAEARHSHPLIEEHGGEHSSPEYCGLINAAAPFDLPLPEAPASAITLAFDSSNLEALRTFVARRARAAGLSTARRDDLTLAVNELASNSVRHGGGAGILREWKNGTSLVCEVIDNGRIEEPLAGRQMPRSDALGGYGLWLVNQLCDLMQMRTFARGSVVRVHMRCG
jgi:anti-sigma regulatory factor (Ser/Thr protein kinase)